MRNDRACECRATLGNPGLPGRGMEEAETEGTPCEPWCSPEREGHGGSLRRSREGAPSHEYNKIQVLVYLAIVPKY